MFDKASPAEAEDDSIDAFTDILRDAEKLMGRANPRLLRTYEHKGLQFSEPLELIQRIMTADRRRVPLVRAHPGARKRVVEGQGVSVRGGLGGRGSIKKK